MKVLLFANTDWYLFNFKLGFARFLRAQGHDVVMVSPPGPFAERLTAAGFRWISLPMERRSLNPLREAAILKRLTDIYRKESPEIAHHFTIKCAVYGTAAARMANVPAVVNAITGLGFVFVSRTLRARLLHLLVRQLLRWTCRPRWVQVVVQNQDDVALFRDTRLSRGDNLSLIRGSGVDVSLFRPRPVPDQAGPLVVLFSGRLLYDKGVAEFVECARRARRFLPPDTRFLVAGEPDPGNPAAVSRPDLMQWQASGAVEFLGHVEDMPALVSASDIFVLPSYGEGTPRSLIEAAACEKPIIATDVRGCREVVHDGINGLLVPPRDVAALVDALRRLANDPGLRQRMGSAGRRHVLANLDEQIVFRETRAVYEQLLERRDLFRAGRPDPQRYRG